jgi:hypothetical protein
MHADSRHVRGEHHGHGDLSLLVEGMVVIIFTTGEGDKICPFQVCVNTHAVQHSFSGVL